MKLNIFLVATSVVIGFTSSMPASAQDDQRAYLYGPKTCRSGYVWRNAFSGDAACVDPAQRTQASKDNAAAAQRIVPGSAQCKPPFVPRQARPTDRVCVTTETRDRVADDNRLAYSRMASTKIKPNRPVGRGSIKEIPDPLKPLGGCKVLMVCPPNWQLGTNSAGHCECMYHEPGTQ